MSAKGIRAGKAFVEIGADSAPLDAALQRLRGRIDAFGRALAMTGAGMVGLSGAALGPLLAAARSFASAGDNIEKMATRLGVSAEQLSTLGFAAEQSGTDLQTLEGALFRLSRVAIGAAEDGGAAAEALAQMGLSADELAAMSPDEQFKIVASALAGITDSGKRAQLAYQLFGRSAADLMPLLAAGAEGIEEMQERARELGLEMGTEEVAAAAALNDAMNELSRSVQAAWRKIGAAIAPTLTVIASNLATVVGHIVRFIDENRAIIMGVAAAAVALGTLGAALMGAGVAVSIASVALGALTSPLALVGGGIAAVAAALAAWPGLWSTIREAAEGVFTYLSTQFPDITATFGKVGETLKATWKSFVDAVSAGDLKAGFEVVAAGLGLSWAQSVAGMGQRWYSIVDTLLDYWTDASTGIAVLASQAFFAVTNLATIMKDATLTAFGWIGQKFQEFLNFFSVKMGRMTQDEADAQSKEMEAARLRAQAQRNLDRANTNYENEMYLQELANMAEEEKEARRRSRQADLSEAEKALEAAEEAFEDAKNKAADAADAVVPPDKKRQVDDESDKAKSTTAALSGMFNAMFAGQQVGLKELQERTARAAERTARGVDRLNENARQGGGVAVN